MKNNFEKFRQAAASVVRLQEGLETIPQLKWSDLDLGGRDESELENKAINFVSETMSYCEFKDGEEISDANYLAINTINEVRKNLNEISDKQSAKLTNYIVSTVATIQEKMAYCQLLIATCYLAATKDKEERVNFCEAVAASAIKCIGGSVASLKMMQAQMAGSSTDLAMLDINRYSFLSMHGDEVHSQSHFLNDYGGKNEDQLSTSFPSSITHSFLRQIIEKNAFAHKELFEDSVQSIMTGVIMEEKSKTQDESQFADNLFQRLSTHKCKLINYLAKDCFDNDDCNSSPFFNATGDDLKEKVAHVVKNNTLNSVNVVISKKEKDVILSSLTALVSGKDIPYWLIIKIRECGGKDRLSTFIPNPRYKEMMMQINELAPEPEVNSIDDCARAGFPIDKIEQKIKDGMPALKYINYGQALVVDIDLYSLASNPDSFAIQAMIKREIDKENEFRQKTNDGRLLKNEMMQKIYTSSKDGPPLFNYGLADAFFPESIILNIIKQVGNRPYFMNNISLSAKISALKATEASPDGRKRLLQMKPLIIDSIYSLNESQIPLLGIYGVKSKGDFLRYALKPILAKSLEPSSQVNIELDDVMDVLNQPNFMEDLFKKNNKEDSRKALIFMISILHGKHFSKLITDQSTTNTTIIENLILLVPEYLGAIFDGIKKHCSHDQIAKLINLKDRVNSNALTLIASKCPDQFVNFFKSIEGKLSNEDILNLIMSRRNDVPSWPSVLIEKSPESFKYFFEFAVKHLSEQGMENILFMTNRSGSTLLTDIINIMPNKINNALNAVSEEALVDLLISKNPDKSNAMMCIAKNCRDQDIGNTFSKLSLSMSKNDIRRLLTCRDDFGDSFTTLVAKNSKDFFKGTIIDYMRYCIDNNYELRAECEKKNKAGFNIRELSGMSGGEFYRRINGDLMPETKRPKIYCPTSQQGR